MSDGSMEEEMNIDDDIPPLSDDDEAFMRNMDGL